MLFLIIIKSLVCDGAAEGEKGRGPPPARSGQVCIYWWVERVPFAVLVAPPPPLPMGVNPFAYEIIAHATTRFQRCTQHRPFYPDRMARIAKKLRLSFVSIFAFLLFHYRPKGATNSISFVAPSLLRDSTLKSRKKRPAAAAASTLKRERKACCQGNQRPVYVLFIHPRVFQKKSTSLGFIVKCSQEEGRWLFIRGFILWLLLNDNNNNPSRTISIRGPLHPHHQTGLN